jgi:hypothetical protein
VALPQVWSLLTTAVAWSLQLPVVSLAADPLHPLFAVALQLPTAADAAAEQGQQQQQQQQQQQGVHSHILVFHPSSPSPQLSCPVPHTAVSALMFVPPGSRLYSSAAVGGPSSTVSPLVMATQDRRYALLHVPISAAQQAGQQQQQQPGLEQQEQEQEQSAFEAAFGPAAVVQAAPAAGKAAAAAAAAAAAQQQQVQQQVAALFDAPSHVLPPPSQLCSAFLELLVTGQRSA